jgi:hypothetical protein
MEIRNIGIDLGKTVFHFVGVNARGEVVVRKKGSRTQLLRFTSNLPKCLIGMEARLGDLHVSQSQEKSTRFLGALGRARNSI